MKKYSLLIYLILLNLFCLAQKEANIWYFGENAGLDFNSGSPLSLTNGQLSSEEGCASIADSNGNILFYTDGSTVWNKNHSIMTNGTGLLGHFSSTQSAIIIPKPGNSDIYYIITVAAIGWAQSPSYDGINYSEVDMTLSNGNGAITSNKNIMLNQPSCEKITAVTHANGSDIWLITHNWNSNSFLTYHVSQNGINTTPVISNCGTYITSNCYNNNTSSIGYMKAAPNGSYLAAMYYCYKPQLFDFDNSTGVVSNERLLPLGNSLTNTNILPYGVEFSPASNFIYIYDLTGGWASIHQYKLDTSDIISSEHVIVSSIDSSTSLGLFGSLQLGPDNKIYVAEINKSSLGVINDPNQKGSKSNYKNQAVDLSNKICESGLPSFIQSYFNSGDFNYDSLCYMQETEFNCLNNTSAIISWDFGDPNSGANNQETGKNVSHIFSSSGTYNVKMSFVENGTLEIIEKQITIHPKPELNIDDTISFCNQNPNSVIIDVFENDGIYLWSDGTTEHFLNITDTGQYSVSVLNTYGCINSKQFDVIDSCTKNIVFLPSAFSPNEDGENDILYVRGNQVRDIKFNIYNRLGELVFISNDINYGWDGKINGKKLNSGVFVFTLIANFLDGENKEIKGTITLLQ